MVAAFLFALSLQAHKATAQSGGAIPSELRSCACSIEKPTLQTALDLKHAGWTYVMQEPKSRQASWGNHDRRTTWFDGYWTNLKTHATSSMQPIKDANGQWVGDGQGGRTHYRNGGSPGSPSEVEWLCSTIGGVAPQ
jgi:hypothetical protein